MKDGMSPAETWAGDGKRHLDVAQGPRATPPEAARITLDDLLARDDLPPDVRAWLEQAAAARARDGTHDWARAHNPPGFVHDEGCWDKAKSAAGHAGADDVYAFATWWYQENCA